MTVTQAQYDAATAAIAAVLQSDLTQLVPSWAQGMIPPDTVAQLSPALAKAAVNAALAVPSGG